MLSVLQVFQRSIPSVERLALAWAWSLARFWGRFRTLERLGCLCDSFWCTRFFLQVVGSCRRMLFYWRSQGFRKLSWAEYLKVLSGIAKRYMMVSRLDMQVLLGLRICRLELSFWRRMGELLWLAGNCDSYRQLRPSLRFRWFSILYFCMSFLIRSLFPRFWSFSSFFYTALWRNLLEQGSMCRR